MTNGPGWSSWVTVIQFNLYKENLLVSKSILNAISIKIFFALADLVQNHMKSVSDRSGSRLHEVCIRQNWYKIPE